MSSSSFSTPPTPRFRPTDSAEEPLILPQHTEPQRVKPQIWITRGRTILLGVLLSLGVWILMTFTASPHLHPAEIGIPVIDIDTIQAINATLPHSGNKTTWTIPIPSGINAPLRPHVYRGICASAHMVGAAANGAHEHAAHHSYYWFDRLFVDPADTEPVPEGPEICDASLTYLLESSNAGFGVALMGLWSAYGLAKKEGRVFFVNDRDWAWGSYLTYFIPPTAKCAPPPAHWLLPCPHRAKHLVVAAATHTYIFGHAFADEFEDPRKMGALRQSHIFDIVRRGYEDLFRLSLRKDDLAAVEDRKHDTEDPVTAVHVRRGDKHAIDFEFHAGYVPLARYVQAALEMADNRGTAVYASDDPAVYDALEFDGFEPAWLPPRGPFVADEFWSLDMGMRELVGREYLRDLKTLGELAARKGAVVCDAASVTCRLLAVIMGWERAIVNERWKNVDGGYDWSGVDW